MAGLVTVDTFTSPWDAHIARSLLESEGIPAFLGDENMVGMDWPLSQALGGVKLKVSAADVEQARVVLKEWKEGHFEAALVEELALATPVCPRCGSKELEPFRSERSRFLTFLFGIFTAAIFPPPISGLRCERCGHEFPGSP